MDGGSIPPISTIGRCRALWVASQGGPVWQARAVSYDFDVFLGRAADLVELADCLTSVPGLAISDRTLATWQVVRGAAAKYSFTVEPTVRIDVEDVPDEVSELMFTPQSLIEILIEGSDTGEIPFARRAARALAERFDGVALDKQTDELWPRHSRRVATKPQRAEVVALVEFRWFLLPSTVTATLIEDWLALCRRYVPEALPRRYGQVEPLQGKLADGGEPQLLREWDTADDTLYFVGTTPVTDGSLPVTNVRPWARDMLTTNVNVSVLASAFDDDRWIAGFRALFTEFARRSRCIYAYGEVIRGLEWSGRKAWFSAKSEPTVFPGRRDGWLGLVPYPVFWAWYGASYFPLLAGRLTHGTQEVREDSVFHELAEKPVDRDALLAMMKPARFRRRVDWVPRELRATELANPRRSLPVPADPATVMPKELRS